MHSGISGRAEPLTLIFLAGFALSVVRPIDEVSYVPEVGVVNFSSRIMRDISGQARCFISEENHAIGKQTGVALVLDDGDGAGGPAFLKRTLSNSILRWKR